MLVLELRVRVKTGNRVRKAQGTKRLCTKRLGYVMSPPMSVGTSSKIVFPLSRLYKQSVKFFREKLSTEKSTK